MLLTLTRELFEYKGNSFISRWMHANSHPRGVSLTCRRGPVLNVRASSNARAEPPRSLALSPSADLRDAPTVPGEEFTLFMCLSPVCFQLTVCHLAPRNEKLGLLHPDRRYHDNCGLFERRGSGSRRRRVISSFYCFDIPAVVLAAR